MMHGSSLLNPVEQTGATRGKTRFGFCSLVSGALACVLFVTVVHISRGTSLLMGGGNVLRALDQLGLVRRERRYMSDLTPGNALALNDANVVLWLTWLAFGLALLAIGSALRAEYRHEPTLYSSAGVVLAILGAGLFSFPAMAVAVTISAVGLTVVRKRRLPPQDL